MREAAGKSARYSRFRRRIEELLEGSDIRINGDRSWDIHVHDERFFRWVLAEGSLALGESYMEGMWDAERLDEMIARLLRINLDRKLIPRSLILDIVRAKIINLQSPARSFKVGEYHYDLGNELYERMLDKNMIYSCAYWKDADDLDQAQENKLDLICRKLELQPGMRVLDIGCGWGGTAKFIAEHYDCSVVGVTISQEQYEYAQSMCAGLPVDVRLQDYRDINERFDRIVSIGMFEHVGQRNYRSFMKVAAANLKSEGLFLLHSIGGSRSVRAGEPWLERYIFPNSMLPSLRYIAEAAEGLFVMEDWQNFGAYYDITLMHWYRNFSQAWQDLSEYYDERFRRMWTYFLLSCAGSFRARRNQLWQIVFSPRGVSGVYLPIR